MICSGGYSSWFSRFSFSEMALRASIVPGVGSYLVFPACSALIAACLMKSGVSKSGSPAPKETTSTPAFLRALALAVTARVIDSAMRSRR